MQRLSAMSDMNCVEYDDIVEFRSSGAPRLSSFACVDLNQLWAAAVPLEIEEDTQDGTDRSTSSPMPTRAHNDANDPDSDLADIAAAKATTSLDPEEGGTEGLAIEPEAHPSAVIDSDHHLNVDKKPRTTAPSRSRLETAVQFIKYTNSILLLVFCIVMCSAAIFTEQTKGTYRYGFHPVLAYCIFWFILLWLAMMEAGLNCMVGLKPVDGALYKSSHPWAYKCMQLINRGDNLERYIVGRQFLDLSCVFMTSLLASSIKGASVFGLPSLVCDIFLGGGVAAIMVTVVIGQLVSQVNAAHCMLDFINNRVMLGTTYLAVGIANSGFLHATYLLRIVVCKIAGQPILSAEPPRSTSRNIWFWCRVMFSSTLLCCAFAVTIDTILNGNTTMWAGVPPLVSIFLLVGLIAMTANIDGLQIALFAFAHLPEEELAKNPVARNNFQLTFRENNLQAFLVGRQILQTSIMFMIARITTINIGKDEDTVFGVGKGMQQFLNFGIPGAFISTIVASLSWRILATSFPRGFLANPFANATIRLCLFLDFTGIVDVSWLLAAATKKLLGLKSDVTYIGTVTERTAAAKQNEDLELSVGPSTSSESSTQSTEL
jgi:hypothetical protein